MASGHWVSEDEIIRRITEHHIIEGHDDKKDLSGEMTDMYHVGDDLHFRMSWLVRALPTPKENPGVFVRTFVGRCIGHEAGKWRENRPNQLWSTPLEKMDVTPWEIMGETRNTRQEVIIKTQAEKDSAIEAKNE